jgi:hypothetical protein
MNKLPPEQRAQALQMMAEGISLRAITRLIGISRTTLIKLLEDAGQAFSEYMDRTLVKLPCKRVQLDECWGFSYCKQKNVAGAKAAPAGSGDIWTWVGLCADTKLVASYYVGGRDSEAAMTFVDDLAPRVASRVQITTDGHKPYIEAIEGAFGGDVDYAILVKVYGEAPEGQRRYPARRFLAMRKWNGPQIQDRAGFSYGEFGHPGIRVKHRAQGGLQRTQPGFVGAPPVHAFPENGASHLFIAE